MAYTTLDKIRDEAGFTGNANVTDAKVEDYRTPATSQIDASLVRRYDLPLESTPDILELIERKLAAGHLLLDEYGVEAEGTGKDGQIKVDWAEAQLMKLEDGTLVLLDSDGDSLTISGAINLKGFPDDSTGTDKTTQSEKDDPPIFEIGEQF